MSHAPHLFPRHGVRPLVASVTHALSRPILLVMTRFTASSATNRTRPPRTARWRRPANHRHHGCLLHAVEQPRRGRPRILAERRLQARRPIAVANSMGLSWVRPHRLGNSAGREPIRKQQQRADASPSTSRHPVHRPQSLPSTADGPLHSTQEVLATSRAEDQKPIHSARGRDQLTPVAAQGLVPACHDAILGRLSRSHAPQASLRERRGRRPEGEDSDCLTYRGHWFNRLNIVASVSERNGMRAGERHARRRWSQPHAGIIRRD